MLSNNSSIKSHIVTIGTAATIATAIVVVGKILTGLHEAPKKIERFGNVMRHDIPKIVETAKALFPQKINEEEEDNFDI